MIGKKRDYYAYLVWEDSQQNDKTECEYTVRQPS